MPAPGSTRPVDGPILAQCSAHGEVLPAVLDPGAEGAVLRWLTRQRRVAPGQSVVFYDAGDEHVLGGGIAA